MVYMDCGYHVLLDRGTHICVSILSIIGSDSGLSPGRRQVIIWINAGISLIFFIMMRTSICWCIFISYLIHCKILLHILEFESVTHHNNYKGKLSYLHNNGSCEDIPYSCYKIPHFNVTHFSCLLTYMSSAKHTVASVSYKSRNFDNVKVHIWLRMYCTKISYIRRSITRSKNALVHEKKMYIKFLGNWLIELYKGSILLTWINFNSSMDR